MAVSRRDVYWLPLVAGTLAASAQVQAGKSPAAKPLGRGYVQGPYGLIHYRDTGAGQPLVLLHQSPMDSRQFNSVYPLFAAKGIRAVGIDMPGFGNSDVTPFVPRVEDWAKVVPAVLDHLGIEQADIAGHHTGACTATEVSLVYPSRVRKLIIHAALIISPQERAKRLQRVRTGEANDPYKEDGSHLTDTFAGRKKLYGPGASPQLITGYVIQRYTGDGPSWYGHNAAYMYDHNSAIMKVKSPTLLMDNTGDMTYDMTQQARSMRPDFRYVEFQGGGVDIVDQQSQAWVDAIQRFIQA